MTTVASPPLPDGLVAVVKRDCPTCVMVTDVLAELAAGPGVTVICQDDPSFPDGLGGVIHDVDLAMSWHHDIETVPTLLRVSDGAEQARTVGWSRREWSELSGATGLGRDLPEMRPGCGSLSVDPGLADELRVRFGGSVLKSRRVDIAELEDEWEAAHDRGWSDGLPVVPPTEARVLSMLEGTWRDPDDVVAIVPPDLVECTVEKVAINAVMAGCRPEYLPVVLTALEAACTDTFNAHGVLATTMPVGPVLIVNGPIRRRLGLWSGRSVLGPGNRANTTIGRALQLVIRNVGGGRPGEGGVDRATHGNPGKIGLCVAELEEGSPFEPLSVSRGLPAGIDALTLFAGEGPRCVVDQLSRDADSLARSLAASLRSMYHPKLALGFDAVVVIGPEHGRVLSDDGWDRSRLSERLIELTSAPGAEWARGAGGMAEGLPERFADAPSIPKFRDDGLLLVHAGGGAGLFSAIIGGWANGATGSTPVTVPIPREGTTP